MILAGDTATRHTSNPALRREAKRASTQNRSKRTPKQPRQNPTAPPRKNLTSETTTQNTRRSRSAHARDRPVLLHQAGQPGDDSRRLGNGEQLPRGGPDAGRHTSFLPAVGANVDSCKEGEAPRHHLHLRARTGGGGIG